MKIAFVTTGDIQSIATSKRAFGLAEPLIRLGYKVSIIAESTPNNRHRMQQEAPNATPLWFEPCGALKEVQLKREILRVHQADIVYISALGVRNFAWSRSRAKTSRYMIEHSELASAIKSQSWSRRTVSLVFELLSMYLFDGHIVASRFLEQHINMGLARLRLKRSVLYSPYAYSASMLVTDPEVTARIRDVSGSRRVLVYMGTLARNYGILDIIEAVGKLRKEMPDLLLFVLGKGRDAVFAEAKVRDLGLEDHVQLEGYVSDEAMPSYLERADVFIAPLYNTIQDIARCPSKLFLYLPFKRPIVTSRIGEADALFGNYEYYFRPGDTEDMARALQNAFGQSKVWNPPWSVDDHSWERRAQEFDAWLRSLPQKSERHMGLLKKDNE